MRLKFRLNGYVSRQYIYIWTVTWRMIILQVAAGGFYTQRNFVADFIRLKSTTKHRIPTEIDAYIYSVFKSKKCNIVITNVFVLFSVSNAVNVGNESYSNH